MPRHIAFLFTLVAALTGCATAPSPIVNTEDSVDAVIAASAQQVTQALRELSEVTGNSRTVTAAPSKVTTTQPSAPAPRLPAATIASSTSSIAISEPQSTVSSGAVTSSTGGLLSKPPAGLEKYVTVRWTGDVEQLVGKIAHQVGWAIEATSGLRVAPVIISINAENRTAFDVLRDIGAIAGTSADIYIMPTTKSISVRYPKR